MYILNEFYMSMKLIFQNWHVQHNIRGEHSYRTDTAKAHYVATAIKSAICERTDELNRIESRNRHT